MTVCSLSLVSVGAPWGKAHALSTLYTCLYCGNPQFPNSSRCSINIGWLTEWMKFLDVAKQTLSFTFCGFYRFWLILLHPFFFLFGLQKPFNFIFFQCLFQQSSNLLAISFLCILPKVSVSFLKSDMSGKAGEVPGSLGFVQQNRDLDFL